MRKYLFFAAVLITLALVNTNAQIIQQASNFFSASGTASGMALFQDGTVGAPSIAFASQPGMGFYRVAASTLDFVSPVFSTTLPMLRFAGGEGIILPASLDLAFTASGGAGGTVDTRLGRAGAGEFGLTTPITFSTLGTPANGSFGYCSDCTVTTPATCPATKASCVCTGSGNGAFAVRLNSSWDCTLFQ